MSANHMSKSVHHRILLMKVDKVNSVIILSNSLSSIDDYNVFED